MHKRLFPALAALLAAVPAPAADFPSRPVRIVVGFGAGGLAALDSLRHAEVALGESQREP